MYISQLEVSHVRNLLSFKLNPHPSTNFIFGPNGSGKTSLLESICLLSSGRSFRTPILKKIITTDESDLVVYGLLRSLAGDDVEHKVGIRKSLDGETLVKIDGTRRERASDLAQMLPTVDLDASSFELVDGGPSVRRNVLDWGLFHVEHGFLDCWKRYRLALTQKNALLRGGNTKNMRQQVELWNTQLAQHGDYLDRLRTQYIEKLDVSLQIICTRYFDSLPVSIHYRSGWNKITHPGLGECLSATLNQDIEKGSASIGPHRADLVIEWLGKPARDICSRGQKKLVIYAVRLAQVMVLRDLKNVSPVLLLDDIPSELDNTNIEKISRFLNDYPCQTFITAISQDAFDSGLLPNFQNHQMFHVEHGQLVAS